MIALFVPAALAASTAHATRDARAATATAIWSGLVGGLLAFITWVTATYLRDGRPYDPQLLRDFHHSHAHNLAAYAVSDNLGTALSLLVLIPVDHSRARLARRPRHRQRLIAYVSVSTTRAADGTSCAR